MAAVVDDPAVVTGEKQLNRNVGFWGLAFVSLGSIIGSGWLLGALTAASFAGGGSLITWVLAVIMLMVLALIHADLGAAYPVAGGTSRYPHYAFGSFAGFTAGWTTYLQAVAIAPLEVEASLGYVSSIGWFHEHFNMVDVDGHLTVRGIVVGVVFMLLFCAINLGGGKLMSDSNTGIVLWKIAVPVLTIITLLIISFHPGNFTANGGFLPFGFHGVFAALPAGVVFALQGFEQATQMAGESKDPQKHVAKAIILAMVIGAIVYIGLEIAFVGALDPASLLANGWAEPIGTGDYGPYYTLAINSGVAWLAVILIVDAVISPGGTGLIYVGTTARISYALGLPNALTKTTKRGVPMWSILVATAFGLVFLAPAPSWQQLVGLITGGTAVMYAYAPVALGALLKNDPDRVHPYKAPARKVLLPLGFVFATLIIYWGGFDSSWKLAVGLLIGQLIFAVAALARAKNIDVTRARFQWAAWFWSWQIALIVLGYLGNYGDSSRHILPEDFDALIVAVIGLLFYFFGVKHGAITRRCREDGLGGLRLRRARFAQPENARRFRLIDRRPPPGSADPDLLQVAPDEQIPDADLGHLEGVAQTAAGPAEPRRGDDHPDPHRGGREKRVQPGAQGVRRQRPQFERGPDRVEVDAVEGAEPVDGKIRRQVDHHAVRARLGRPVAEVEVAGGHPLAQLGGLGLAQPAHVRQRPGDVGQHQFARALLVLGLPEWVPLAVVDRLQPPAVVLLA